MPKATYEYKQNQTCQNLEETAKPVISLITPILKDHLKFDKCVIEQIKNHNKFELFSEKQNAYECGFHCSIRR